MSDSGKLLLKIVLVLLVFPAVAELVSLLSGFVLYWPVWLLPQGSQAPGFALVQVLAIALGIVGGFLVVWRLWPRKALAAG